MPDVLVLALCGTGPTDQISINYSSVVPTKQVMSDIRAIERETGWLVGGAKVSTNTVSAAVGRRTTSGSFTTLSILDYDNGVLPLEPFVNVLKRFRSIEVNFLTPTRFRFRGLQEFENEFVKIVLVSPPLKATGSTGDSGQVGAGSYLYRVLVKNSDFKHIDLPKRQPSAQPSKQHGLSIGARAAWVLAIAVACGAAAYLVAYLLFKTKRNAQA